MTTSEQSTIIWNPDGYMEVKFVGVQMPQQMREIDAQARAILDERGGTASLLVDARHGRIGRDAASFSVLMKLSRDRRLRHLVVLVDEMPTDPNAGKESGVIVSMLTAALGKRPIYIFDEAAARALAASE
jgi:hypothetical protein